WYATIDLDRHRTIEAAEVEAEASTGGFIKGRTHTHLGIGITARLAILERGRHTVDLDVAADLIAVVIGRYAQVRGFDLLAQHHSVGGKIRDVHVDRVLRPACWQIGLQRHA